MRLVWSSRGIPHGFLSETPIHLIYRVRGCAPVGELRRLHDDLDNELKSLRQIGTASSARIEVVLERWLDSYDALLDAQDQSKYVLAKTEAAAIVVRSWLTLVEMGEIFVYALCVMGNHVHIILRGADGRPDQAIGLLVNRHKRYTGRRVGDALQIDSDIWDDGFYDRYVRPGTFWTVMLYLLNNPVKAGLVVDWRDWPATYVDPRCVAMGKRLGLL